jgi:hypothetical protein
MKMANKNSIHTTTRNRDFFYNTATKTIKSLLFTSNLDEFVQLIAEKGCT